MTTTTTTPTMSDRRAALITPIGPALLAHSATRRREASRSLPAWRRLPPVAALGTLPLVLIIIMVITSMTATASTSTSTPESRAPRAERMLALPPMFGPATMTTTTTTTTTPRS